MSENLIKLHRALVAMRYAGLPDYGRWPRSVEEEAFFVNIYARVIEREGRKLFEHVGEAAVRFATSGREFPSTAVFVDMLHEIHAERYRIRGVETGHGSVRMEEVLREARVSYRAENSERPISPTSADKDPATVVRREGFAVRSENDT